MSPACAQARGDDVLGDLVDGHRRRRRRARRRRRSRAPGSPSDGATAARTWLAVVERERARARPFTRPERRDDQRLLVELEVALREPLHRELGRTGTARRRRGVSRSAASSSTRRKRVAQRVDVARWDEHGLALGPRRRSRSPRSRTRRSACRRPSLRAARRRTTRRASDGAQNTVAPRMRRSSSRSEMLPSHSTPGHVAGAQFLRSAGPVDADPQHRVAVEVRATRRAARRVPCAVRDGR